MTTARDAALDQGDEVVLEARRGVEVDLAGELDQAEPVADHASVLK